MHNTMKDRRKNSRIDITAINDFYRQCDISTSSAETDIDITIVNISTNGMKFILNSKNNGSILNLDDEIFIRGCIFNDNIGFLSSQKAITVWREESFIGVKFTPELDLEEISLIEMLKQPAQKNTYF